MSVRAVFSYSRASLRAVYFGLCSVRRSVQGCRSTEPQAISLLAGTLKI